MAIGPDSSLLTSCYLLVNSLQHSSITINLIVHILVSTNSDSCLLMVGSSLDTGHPLYATSGSAALSRQRIQSAAHLKVLGPIYGSWTGGGLSVTSRYIYIKRTSKLNQTTSLAHRHEGGRDPVQSC